MKRVLLLFIGAVLSSLVFYSCDEHLPAIDEKPNTHKLVVTVNAGDTKATMNGNITDGFSMLWEPGDRIDLFEVNESMVEYDNVKVYASAPLSAADLIDGGASARFSFEIEDWEGSRFQYIASYPCTHDGGEWDYQSFCMYDKWEPGDDQYSWWCEKWSYTGDQYMEPHPVLMVELPYRQSPTANSFDWNANTMVSQRVISDSGQISEELSLSFARLGGIADFVITNLSDYAGQKVTSATVSFGESYGGNLNAEYDSELQRYQYYKGYDRFELTPQDVVIGQNGSADLFFRGYAGKISDWVRIDLFIGDEDVHLATMVNLASFGRSIPIEDGKLTKVSFGTWGVPDVEQVSEISYTVSENADAFAVQWEGVDNAKGYICNYSYYDYETDEWVKAPLEVIDNKNGTFKALSPSGLAPAYYNVEVTPIPEAGHVLIDNYPSSVSIPLGMGETRWIYFSNFSETFSEDTQLFNSYGMDISYSNVSTKGSYMDQYLYTRESWELYISNDVIKQLDWISMCISDGDSKVNVYAASSPGGKDVRIEPEKTNENWRGRYYKYEFPEGTKYFTISGTGESTLTDYDIYVYGVFGAGIKVDVPTDGSGNMDYGHVDIPNQSPGGGSVNFDYGYIDLTLPAVDFGGNGNDNYGWITINN